MDSALSLAEIFFISSIRIESSIWKIPFSVDLNPVSDNLFDAGLLAEAGIGYTLGSGELLISARYQYSFTSLDRKYQKNQVHRYIDTLSITAGYSFSLGDKK